MATITKKAATATTVATTTATVTTPAPICLTAGYTVAQHTALQNPTGTHVSTIVTKWLTTVGGTQAQCNVVICPNIVNNAYVAKHLANINNGVATRSILALVYGIPVVNGAMLGQSITAQFKAAKASVNNGAPPTANNTSNPCPSVAATTQKTFTLAQLLAYFAFVSGTCQKSPNKYRMASPSWRLVAVALSGGINKNAVGFGTGVIKLQIPATASVK